jgi:hypothetical protein
MTRIRRLIISIVAVALGLVVGLSMPPAVTANERSFPNGRLIEPSQRIDGLVGIQVPIHAWHLVLTTPEGELDDQCIPLGRHGKIVLAFAPQCTVTQGTTVYIIGITGWCSNLDQPPWFAEGYRAQVTCVKDFYAGEGRPESIWVTVNGRKLADIHKRRYEMLAPTQSHDQLLPDNAFGFPAEEIHYVVYGWGAWLVDLPLGTHRIHSRTVWPDGSDHIFAPIIHVVP